MLGMLLVALLFFLLFGFGLSFHLLWIAAVIVFVIWLLGFAFTGGGGRWYRW